MTTKKAIIVGAGIGGLATAIQLAKRGLQVTIYEKNSLPGGRCQQIIKDGHVFDSGPTMFLFPKIYSDFFYSIDEDINEYLKLLKCDPIYKLNFSDKKSLVLTPKLNRLKSQLEKTEPGSYSKFLEYLQKSKNFYEIAMQQLTSNSLEKPLDYFNFKNLYLFLRSGALKNHYNYVSELFKNPNLKSAFTFQDSYLSLNPFQSPSIFSMFYYSELREGNYLPQGGMYEVILTLTKIAKKYKVKVLYNTPVKKINIVEERANGVVLENNSIKKADYVIVNADLSYAYKKLLPDRLRAEKLERKRYSCSAVIFHWGLDKVYPQLKTHNLFFSKDYKQEFDKVINHSNPPAKPHFYIQAPARTDPTRAPKQQDTISVIVPINHINPLYPVDWSKYKKQAREYIIKRLLENGLKDVDKHIKFEICLTPEDWQNHLNLTFGAIYGLHHNLAQLGYLREGRQHKKIKNVYFVGASNHPGSGLPTVLLSSRFTSQKILSQINS